MALQTLLVVTGAISAYILKIPLKVVLAFLVGALGSGAYITALYFKFIGDSDGNRGIIIKPFRELYSSDISLKKCIWYAIVGGSIAVVFQVDVPNFVAVQSLILGATWPAIVSQFLSGRMSSPSKEEKQEQESVKQFLASKVESKTKTSKVKDLISKLESKK